jgi:hypothetical protein
MESAYTLDQIENLRDITYHRTPELRATNEEKALAFVNEVGFCFLFGDQAVEIPTLWAAVCGSRRAMPNDHFDGDVGRTWDWKDSLPTRGLIHYGKLLRNKPTLVSLELLPYFYALSPNYGELDDYLQQYEDGKLSIEAKNVYEALLNEGAMSTTRLRQLANLAGCGQNARRFDRAIAELQTELKIAKVGVADTNRWGYAYVYDLFMRRYPHVSEQARHISTDEAMGVLLTQYLRNVIAQPASSVQRLFRWERWEWDALLDRLADEGAIRRGIRVEGLGDDCLAAPEAVIMENIEKVRQA